MTSHKIIVGYLVWRKTVRGNASPSKVIAEKRAFLLANSNKQDQERWTEGLLREVPLDAADWKLGLDALVAKYPVR